MPHSKSNTSGEYIRFERKFCCIFLNWKTKRLYQRKASSNFQKDERKSLFEKNWLQIEKRKITELNQTRIMWRKHSQCVVIVIVIRMLLRWVYLLSLISFSSKYRKAVKTSLETIYNYSIYVRVSELFSIIRYLVEKNSRLTLKKWQKSLQAFDGSAWLFRRFEWLDAALVRESEI